MGVIRWIRFACGLIDNAARHSARFRLDLTVRLVSHISHRQLDARYARACSFFFFLFLFSLNFSSLLPRYDKLISPFRTLLVRGPMSYFFLRNRR